MAIASSSASSWRCSFQVRERLLLLPPASAQIRIRWAPCFRLRPASFHHRRMLYTAEFAVESIRRWWKLAGRNRKQGAQRILICADAGGSNSSRSRTWKLHRQELTDELAMAITVCHYPPGTSKWNKIEHRLFSFISLTWKGQPLINYETVVNLIGATKTKSGLRVKAVLDTNEYETGVKVTKSQMEALCVRRHKTHPDWNYTLEPRA